MNPFTKLLLSYIINITTYIINTNTKETGKQTATAERGNGSNRKRYPPKPATHISPIHRKMAEVEASVCGSNLK